jgi:hypothetical protein
VKHKGCASMVSSFVHAWELRNVLRDGLCDERAAVAQPTTHAVGLGTGDGVSVGVGGVGVSVGVATPVGLGVGVGVGG